MKLAKWGIGLLVVLTVGLSFYPYYRDHEYREVTLHAPFKGEAKTNPLFAARLFLRQMGIATEDRDSLLSMRDLPTPDNVLIIDTSRATLTDEKTETLLDWVRQGGHVITRANVDWEYYAELNEDDAVFEACEKDDEDSCLYTTDPLQRELDVLVGKSVSLLNDETENTDAKADPKPDVDATQEQKQAQAADANDESAEPEGEYEGIFGLFTTETPQENPIQFKAMPRPLKLATLNHFFAIESVDEDEQRVMLKDSIFLLQRSYGDGMITLTSDLDFMGNQLLRNGDNAEILWYLVHANHVNPQSVWLIYNEEMRSLLAILWQKGWAFILSLTLLFIAWLFLRGHRFGPLIPRQGLARRRLLEHIDASGRYFWKHGQQQKLIDSARQALERRIAQIHPVWLNANQQERVRIVAERLEMDEQQVNKLLFGKDFDHPDDFTHLIMQLEKIRRSI